MWTQIGRDRGRDGGEGRRDKQVKIDEIDGGGDDEKDSDGGIIKVK